ncbi:MAG: tRNA (adenosine(37)-N6)-dimethylallyltransferase MiaA [Chloroflexi bacterium]|nr:tRNA (adenosine(37)-N6)-dimethylallyltransferase MiaA [Chloroflexota bacterium]
MKPVIAIVGPTAAGKSRLALELAQILCGEVVNADSRQVYRFMNIGTAKPSPKEQALVPHHLIEIVSPDEEFSLAQYQRLAYEAIADIFARGRWPLLVGGSGLYVWAVVEGWQIPSVPPHWELRHTLEAQDSQKLYQELMKVDPQAAQRIDSRNTRRVIRALEVCLKTGMPFSQFQRKLPPPFPFIVVGLTTGREDLYRRIDERVEAMVKAGLVEEVRGLLERGYSPQLSAMSSVGYKQMIKYLEGKLDLATAIQQMKYETHRLARHQYAWFRPGDQRIRWFDIKDNIKKPISELVAQGSALAGGVR